MAETSFQMRPRKLLRIDLASRPLLLSLFHGCNSVVTGCLKDVLHSAFVSDASVPVPKIIMSVVPSRWQAVRLLFFFLSCTFRIQYAS